MRKTFSRIGFGFLCLISLFMASCVIQVIVTPQNNHGVARVYGHSFLYVGTDSMVGEKKDSLPVGTGIIVREVAPSSLHIGDVVCFYDARLGAINTHRMDKEPTLHGEKYRIHTMADNALSQNYVYDGESFSESELIGLVIGHSDFLGSILSFISPSASALKEVNGGGTSLAWLFPILAFLPIVGILSFELFKVGKKRRRPLPALREGMPIDALPIEPLSETSVPLEESLFQAELLNLLSRNRYPRVALVAVVAPEAEKDEVLMKCKQEFSPLLVGQNEDGFLLYLAPCFVAEEVRRQAKNVLQAYPRCCFGIAFWPDVPEEDLFLAAMTARSEQQRIAFAKEERNAKPSLTIESALKTALSIGFEQARLYLLSPTGEDYALYAEANGDGYFEPRGNVIVPVSDIEPYFEFVEGEEIGLVLSAKSLPLGKGSGLSFYARRSEGVAMLFLRNEDLHLSENQVDHLLKIGEFLANRGLFLRQEGEMKVVSIRLESLLGSSKSLAYEVDPKTHRLTFVSASLRDSFPSAREGVLCHKAFYGSFTPCPRCPLNAKTGVDKPIPKLGSQILHFHCLPQDNGRVLIQTQRAKSKNETPLPFVEAFESSLRANKRGILLLIQAECDETFAQHFFSKAKAFLGDKKFGDGLFDYQNGIAYLLPNLTPFDALTLAETVNRLLNSLEPPPLSFYRFSFPDEVSCRLELDALLRHKKKNTGARGHNAVVE